MDRLELFPSRNRFLVSAALGLALLLVGHRFWRVFGVQSGGPSLAWAWPAVFFAAGAIIAWRATLALLRPRPCFACDPEGFSVMGKQPRRWSDLEAVSVCTVWVGVFPTARWVRVKLRKGDSGRGGYQDIPCTHLPASAKATAHRIEELAAQSRVRRPAAPTAYDPYDPAALSHARSRAL